MKDRVVKNEWTFLEVAEPVTKMMTYRDFIVCVAAGLISVSRIISFALSDLHVF